MTRRLWLRIGLVAFVAAMSIFYLYPPKKTINLGLDLQGGIHLVLGVDIDKALQIQIDRTTERVRSALEAKGIAVRKAERRGNTEIEVQLASPATWAEALTLFQKEFPSFEVKETDNYVGNLDAGVIDVILNFDTAAGGQEPSAQHCSARSASTLDWWQTSQRRAKSE